VATTEPPHLAFDAALFVGTFFAGLPGWQKKLSNP
jgi:hypothetical protein